MQHCATTASDATTNAPTNAGLVVAANVETKNNHSKDHDARGRILTIALKAFASRGFDGVSTTELAKAAGVTQPLIHYHFKSKKALWQTIVRNSFAVLNDEYIQPLHRLPGLDARERSEMAIESFAQFVARRAEFAKILMAEGSQPSERMEWMVAELLTPCLQDLENAYQVGVNAGVLKAMPMAQLISLVLGAASQFFALQPLMATLFNVDTRDSAQAQIHIDNVSTMLKKALIL